MRILVVSDSHGDTYKLKKAIEDQPDISMMIHLGDGERDIDKVSHMLSVPYAAVCGKCDIYSQLPDCELLTVGGKRIYCTHGHKEKVKYGDSMLRNIAKSRNADIALYGHTHVPVNVYDDGLYVFNPGSLREGSFGIIDILPSGIICIHRKM
ncbi:MAG: metallophosphoesterase [Oscillospiraceae bacterium]|nr:metallophosphoesterase [Oscillospiraceae bacterium]